MTDKHICSNCQQELGARDYVYRDYVTGERSHMDCSDPQEMPQTIYPVPHAR